MRLGLEVARERFGGQPVARLATASAAGRPHLVPIVFVLAGDVVYTAVDRKPKASNALRRLANIAENPAVAVLADRYTDDWTRLWWVRADGAARLAEPDEAARAIDLLTAKYPVYAAEPPPGPVIAIEVAKWTGWSGESA